MGVLQVAGITCLMEKENRIVQKFHRNMSRPSLNFTTMWSSSSCVATNKSVKISKDSAISLAWKASEAEGLSVNFSHRDLVIRWSNRGREGQIMGSNRLFECKTFLSLPVYNLFCFWKMAFL